jgi:hypothetical protein
VSMEASAWPKCSFLLNYIFFIIFMCELLKSLKNVLCAHIVDKIDDIGIMFYWFFPFYYNIFFVQVGFIVTILNCHCTLVRLPPPSPWPQPPSHFT